MPPIPDKAHYRELHDASRRLTVLITEADRAKAVQCSPSHCVGANALRRLPGVLDARVGAKSARVLRRNGWHRYDIDADTAAAIAVYDDANEKMPPGFRFGLKPPRKPIGARSGEKPGTNRRSGRRESVATRRPSTRSLFVEPPDV